MLFTVAEFLLGVLLLLGLFTRIAAFLSGLLLLGFALTMAVALGIKAPLDFSVLTASAAGFLLAAHERYAFSVDAFIGSRRSPAR